MTNPFAVRAGSCALLLGLGVFAAQAQPRAVPGRYFCVAAATCPCQSDTTLQLTGQGAWVWGEFSGAYNAMDGKVRFDGNGGTATWGPASVGPGTLTFNEGPVAVVCWQRPDSEGRD